VLRSWPAVLRSGPTAFRRWAVPVVGYAAVAVGLTWPLTAELGASRLPLGGESTATVPQFNLWTMQWNGERIAHGFAGYWNAPIFHPTRGAFALSDPQPLTGLVAAGLHVVVRNPAAVYGVVLLLALVLNGIGAMVLAGRLGVPRGAAWLGGVLALAMPFVFHELGVLQLAMVFPFFFALVALTDLDARPSPGAGARLGIWAGVAFLTSEYYGLFLLVLVAIGAAVVLGRRVGQRVVLGPLLTALGCVALLAAPLLIPQAEFTARYRWSTETVTENSATIADYASLDPDAFGASFLPWTRTDTGEHLSPGTGIVVLAVFGFAIAWAADRRRWAVFLGGGALVALGLSLGLRFGLGGFVPYSVLRDHLAGFSRLRSPFRFAVVVQLLVVMLATVALGRLWSWRGCTGRVVAALVVALTVVEGAVLPASLAQPLPDFAQEGWVRFLRSHPGGVVAMVPFPATNAVEDYEPTTEAMLAAREHGHPLVNGYSGFFPNQYFDLQEQMQAFPELGVASLRARGVRWVVVARSWITPDRRAAMESDPALRRVHSDGRVVVYRLSASTRLGE
jgi:hypothetical protein